MKSCFATLLTLWVLVPLAYGQQNYALTVTDGVSTEELRLGLYPSATDAHDDGLESGVPPIPPSGVFDARLIDEHLAISFGGSGSAGLLQDFRSGDAFTSATVRHEVYFQEGSGTFIDICYVLPPHVTAIIQDVAGGGSVSESVSGSGCYRVPDAFGGNELFLDVTYDPVDLPASASEAEAYAAASMQNTARIDLPEPALVIDPSSLADEGYMYVGRFRDGVQDPEGIAEGSVSDYSWTVTRGDGLTFGADVELAFDVSEIPASGIGDAADVTVYGRNTVGSGTFVVLPSTYSSETGLTTATAPADVAEVVFASDSQPLPVELISFEAFSRERSVYLVWETATEQNNAGFEIQIQREESFQEAAFVAGAGTTNEPQTYTYQLDNLVPGRHLLRLKQVDFDGTASYSPIVEVEMPGTRLDNVTSPSPNPASHRTRFTVSASSAQPVNVAVFDILGRQVRGPMAVQLSTAGTNTVELNVELLPVGHYLIRVTGRTFLEIRRLTVIR